MMNMDRYIVQKLTVTIKRVKRMLLTSNTHHQIWTVYNPINRINHTRINPNHHRVFYQRTLVDIVQSYSNPKISFNEPARIQPHYQLKKSAKMFTCRKSPGSIQGIILSTIPKTLWSCWLSKMCSKEHVIFIVYYRSTQDLHQAPLIEWKGHGHYAILTHVEVKNSQKLNQITSPKNYQKVIF